MKSKNILFYSPDFSLCYSLLIYLQDRYHVTTTTDFDVIQLIASSFDVIILDVEPSIEVENFCKEIFNKFNIAVILTYVFKNQIEEFDSSIRKYVSSIFYKPYDLNEVSNKLSALII